MISVAGSRSSRHFKRSLKPGDTVIDIGANIRCHTRQAAQLVGSGARAFAIEAWPSIFSAMQRSIALNGATNARAIHAAVCNASAELPIYLHATKNLGAGTVIADVASRRDVRIEATVRAARPQDLVPPATVPTASR